MRKFKLAVLPVIAAGAMAMPATSSAQDLGATCDSLLGSGVTVVGPLAIERCLASQPPKCTLTNTLDLVVVRVRYSLLSCLVQNGAGVRGLATVLITP